MFGGKFSRTPYTTAAWIVRSPGLKLSQVGIRAG